MGLYRFIGRNNANSDARTRHPARFPREMKNSVEHPKWRTGN